MGFAILGQLQLKFIDKICTKNPQRIQLEKSRGLVWRIPGGCWSHKIGHIVLDPKTIQPF